MRSASPPGRRPEPNASSTALPTIRLRLPSPPSARWRVSAAVELRPSTRLRCGKRPKRAIRSWLRACVATAPATAPLPPGLQPDVEAAVRAALDEYRKLGAELVEVSLPNAELGIPVYYVVAPAECSSNLSRFDGVRYGHRAADYGDLADMYAKSRAEGFGAEVKRRILVGTYVLSHGYYDAYYLQAQKIRRMIADDFQNAFKQCDVIAGPVAPSVAWKFGENANDPVADYLADIFTLPASLAGLPGMSVPAGFGAQGMPVGLQLIGNYFKEAQLLNAAHRLQQATDFHLQKPAGV